MERRPLRMERSLDDATPGLGETDTHHPPVGRRAKRPDEPAVVQLVDHQRDASLWRLDEIREVSLDTSLGSGGPGLEEEVVLQRAEVVLSKRAIDLDQRLPEPAPEGRREPQIVDRGVLEEVRVRTLELGLRGYRHRSDFTRCARVTWPVGGRGWQIFVCRR